MAEAQVPLVGIANLVRDLEGSRVATPHTRAARRVRIERWSRAVGSENRHRGPGEHRARERNANAVYEVTPCNRTIHAEAAIVVRVFGLTGALLPRVALWFHCIEYRYERYRYEQLAVRL